MIKKLGLTAITALFLFGFRSGEDLSKYKSEARVIVKDFAGSLKAELVKGMKEGGAVAAIDVCKIKAPEIAKLSSEKSDWLVRRTSLKTRNEKNKPDEWELNVLNKFEERKAKGEKLSELEYAELIENNGKKSIRYMKAIPTGGFCLQCHGGSIKAEVKEKLNRLYPNDEAVNFKKGDIRGAFSLIKEIK